MIGKTRFIGIAMGTGRPPGRKTQRGGIRVLPMQVFDTEEQKSRFEQAYQKYSKIGFYYAREILRDDALAEDALHDAFLSLARNMDKIGEIDCNKSFNYFVTIVKNTSISALRRQRRARMIEMDDEQTLFQLEDQGAGPEQQLMEKVSYEQLLEAIRTLKPAYQAPLLLKYANGYTEAEIAKALGMTVSNVSVRIHRAKQKLIPLLRERRENDLAKTGN